MTAEILPSLVAQPETETLFAHQKKALETLALGGSLKVVLDTLVQSIEPLVSGMLGSIVTLAPDGQHLNLSTAPHLPDSYNQLIEGQSIGPTAGSCGTAIFLNEPVIVTDIWTDLRWREFVDIAKQFNLRACWSFPILSSEGK